MRGVCSGSRRPLLLISIAAPLNKSTVWRSKAGRKYVLPSSAAVQNVSVTTLAPPSRSRFQSCFEIKPRNYRNILTCPVQMYLQIWTMLFRDTSNHCHFRNGCTELNSQRCMNEMVRYICHSIHLLGNLVTNVQLDNNSCMLFSYIVNQHTYIHIVTSNCRIYE